VAEAKVSAPKEKGNIIMDMSPYSGAAFLKVGNVKVNGPMRVVIADVQLGKYGKPDLAFDDGSKLSVNATNNGILCRAYGMESDDWIGKEIELALGEIEYQGKPQEASWLARSRRRSKSGKERHRSPRTPMAI
jgi:hypothetical protein